MSIHVQHEDGLDLPHDFARIDVTRAEVDHTDDRNRRADGERAEVAVVGEHDAPLSDGQGQDFDVAPTGVPSLNDAGDIAPTRNEACDHFRGDVLVRQ